MRWLQLGFEISDSDPAAAGRWIDDLVPYVDRSKFEEIETLARMQGRLFRLTGDTGRLEAAAELLDGLPATGASGSRNETRGMIAELQGQTEMARRQYEAALAADPGRLTSANNLANLLVTTGGDLERALALATAATASNVSAEFLDTLAAVQAAPRPAASASILKRSISSRRTALWGREKRSAAHLARRPKSAA